MGIFDQVPLDDPGKITSVFEYMDDSHRTGQTAVAHDEATKEVFSRRPLPEDSDRHPSLLSRRCWSPLQVVAPGVSTYLPSRKITEVRIPSFIENCADHLSHK